MSLLLSGQNETRSGLSGALNWLKSALSTSPRMPHLCRYLPKPIKRSFWAAVHTVRPRRVEVPQPVVSPQEAREQRMEVERIAQANRQERERDAQERIEDYAHVSAVLAKLRARGMR